LRTIAVSASEMMVIRSVGKPSEGGTSSAQYLLDHIFVYRRDQNLPYKSSDI
jgi:hypothetical protein